VAELQHLLLRILTGPNAGAEARLSGRTIVGSSSAADITIADPELAPEHFALQVDGDAVSIAVGDTPVTIGSEARSNGTFRIALFDLIKFGTTCCAVGPEGAAWPAFSPADLLPPAPPPPPEAPPAEESVAAEAAAPAAAEEAPAAAPRRTGRPTLAIVALAVVVLLLGGGYVLFHQFGGAVATVKRATAQDIVAAQQAHGVTVRPDGRDGVIVEGFVVSGEQQRRLRQALLAADIAIKYRVVSLEQQTSAVRTIVAAAGAPLAVEADEKSGKIILDGFLPEMAHSDTLQRVLRRDIADLRPLETRIVTPATVRDDIRARLAEAGLDGLAKVEMAGQVARITGALSDEGRATTRRIADELTKRWSPMVKVEDATSTVMGPAPTPPVAASAPPPPSPPPAPSPSAPAPNSEPVTVKSSAPPARIVIVVGGKDGFVRDDAGRRYEVGDKLANGEIIEEIRVEEIVTSRDGIKYRYTFGGGR
jgi:type III secretion system YscD/HrpQ family protein